MANRITTARDVVDAIGRSRLMEITGKKPPHVSNWLAAGHFPAETFNVMTTELDRLGYKAPPKLWRQIQLKGGRAA